MWTPRPRSGPIISSWDRCTGGRWHFASLFLSWHTWKMVTFVCHVRENGGSCLSTEVPSRELQSPREPKGSMSQQTHPIAGTGLWTLTSIQACVQADPDQSLPCPSCPLAPLLGCCSHPATPCSSPHYLPPLASWAVKAFHIGPQCVSGPISHLLLLLCKDPCSRQAVPSRPTNTMSVPASPPWLLCSPFSACPPFTYPTPALNPAPLPRLTPVPTLPGSRSVCSSPSL